MDVTYNIAERDSFRCCCYTIPKEGVVYMVLNATFNNISAISWRSFFGVEKTGEIHRPVTSYKQTLSHNVVSSTPRHERDLNSHLLW